MLFQIIYIYIFFLGGVGGGGWCILYRLAAYELWSHDMKCGAFEKIIVAIWST